MSTVFSKNKNKRQCSPSTETNNSFVKNVTSKVSGLIPATITKWFQRPTTPTTNATVPVADNTDYSSEDECPESFTTHAPSKRMRPNSPGNFLNFEPTNANSVNNNFDNLDECTPFNSHSTPGRNLFLRESNIVIAPPRPHLDESTIDKSEVDWSPYQSQHSFSKADHSVAIKRKSIFESTSNAKASKRACTESARNAPYFKPGLISSSFYKGTTMYGGAASAYINETNVNHQKIAVNESTSSDNYSGMSLSAKRVLNLLENYSSPRTEAKIISQYLRSPNNSSNNSTGCPNAIKSISYKTQELHVPSITSILRIKQRSRLMDTTNAARQIIASHSSSSHFPNLSMVPRKEKKEKEPSGKFTPKIKSRLTRQYHRENESLNQTVEPVNLPTGVLKINEHELPHINFGISVPDVPLPSTLPEHSTSSVSLNIQPIKVKPIDKLVGISSSKPDFMAPISVMKDIIFDSDSYKFSSPVRISNDSSQITSTPKFTFVSPEWSVDKHKADKEYANSSCVVGGPKESEKLTVSSKDWKCSECWVSNKSDVNKCVCCGAQQQLLQITTKPNKCSYCKVADSQPNKEKCVNCEKNHQNNAGSILNKKIETSKWKCDNCWVFNDENIEKCICCGANCSISRVTKKETASPALPIVNVGNPSKWKCEDCWVSNDDNVEICACCGKNKPKKTIQGKSSILAVIPNDSEWECDSCWIKNKSNLEKCAACGKVKPENKSSSTQANSLVPSASSALAFVNMGNSSKWKCEECWVSNDNNVVNCSCCGKNKPKKTIQVRSSILVVKSNSTVPYDSEWKCGSCWIKNMSNLEKCAACGESKPENKSSSTPGNSFVPSASPALPAINSSNSSKWKCEDCWVSNDENVEKCPCGKNNPKKTIQAKNSILRVKTHSAVPNESEWKCDSCWIRNKNIHEKCAACGEPKPTNKFSSMQANSFAPQSLKSSDSLSSIVNSQNEKWECSSCLVQNECNRSKCACCEADKPGTVSPSVKSLFNFGVNSNTFKFGIDLDAKAQSSNSTTNDDKPAVVPSKPEDTEKNNNVLTKTPKMTFGIQLKKIEDLKEPPRDDNSLKPSFSFGIPKSLSTAFASKDVLNSVKEDTKDEKLQEVPKVEFSLPTPEEVATKPLPAMFGDHVKTPLLDNNIANQTESSIKIPISTSTEEAEPNSLPIQNVTDVTNITETQTSSTYKFSSSAVTAATNVSVPAANTPLFSDPAISLSQASPIPLFNSSNKEHVPALSVFPKSEAATTSSVSLFQNPEITSTVAQLPPAATAPIFSFGNNTSAQTTTQQPEKPKYNFTFGSTTTMFNNTFVNATVDTNANKFGTTGSTLGGNGLPAHTLGGGNGLSTSPPLGGGNGLSASKLPSATNDLSSNSMLPGNGLQGGNNLFETPAQKENLWSSPNTNLFVAKSSNNSLPTPANFSFGSATPFSTNTSSGFGNNPTPSVNMFGMGQNTPLFSNPVQNQPSSGLFGTTQTASNPTPGLSLFGNPSVASTLTFGTTNPTLSTFETTSAVQTSAATPAFNFGAQQQPVVFGFGQAQPAQPQQQPTPGLYNFGGAPGATQVQFNMGTAPSVQRRVRKAVRRNSPR